MADGPSRFVADTMRDVDSGHQIVVLCSEGPGPKLQARVAPFAGMNVYSLTVDGVELLKSPTSLDDLPGTAYGVPVLYPTPNRVRDSRFTFDGRTFEFSPNERTHFLHGLVHNVPWEVDEPRADANGASVRGRLRFEPGSETYQRFPFRSELALTVTLERGGLRFEYDVINRDDKRLPFGFALHPWFLYLSTRANTQAWVPASARMATESSAEYALLPTGELESLDGHPADLRTPRSLEGVVLDDVFFGMHADRPAGYADRSRGIQVTLPASDDFTHMVVYTPAGADWFCMENQTCSTDAHNLHARGITEPANLQIVPPGASSGGWVRWVVEKR